MDPTEASRADSGGPAPRARGDGPSVGTTETSYRRAAPRARGDGPHSSVALMNSASCSPCTRGWTHSGHLDFPLGDLLPAHAGMDPPSSLRSTGSQAASRARGEGPGDGFVARPRLLTGQARMPMAWVRFRPTVSRVVSPRKRVELMAVAGHPHHRQGARWRPLGGTGSGSARAEASASRASLALCSRCWRATSIQCGTGPCSSMWVTRGLPCIWRSRRAYRSWGASTRSGGGAGDSGDAGGHGTTRSGCAAVRGKRWPRGAVRTERTLGSSS